MLQKHKYLYTKTFLNFVICWLLVIYVFKIIFLTYLQQTDVKALSTVFFFYCHYNSQLVLASKTILRHAHLLQPIVSILSPQLSQIFFYTIFSFLFWPVTRSTCTWNLFKQSLICSIFHLLCVANPSNSLSFNNVYVILSVHNILELYTFPTPLHIIRGVRRGYIFLY